MSTVALRRFSNPDTLRHIGDRYLIELLSPHRAFFASRGLDLPATPTDGPVDCERLSNIFMTPDTDMPPDLADTLYYIHEMALKETMDKLIEKADQRHIDLDLPPDADPPMAGNTRVHNPDRISGSGHPKSRLSGRSGRYQSDNGIGTFIEFCGLAM